ncbi:MULTISPECIES: hypothetical protein [unclassified Cupriavidus]|uniref:hypothetical protein n=1 Tax=unclassified Cupriavidus TaxID=2640874 RepID=UPI0012EB1561|nr:MULTISPECIES: hypothetical protein [unclassified Cupriavidus]MBP0632872.1 hypothetical protein [Cupriavidus sp. AcVe19-1a]MBP0639209.1 hypothetical protein [Cupriavidus sp. AcVe19-6a]
MNRLLCMGFAALMLACAGCRDTGATADGSSDNAMGAIASTGERANGELHSLYLLR